MGTQSVQAQWMHDAPQSSHSLEFIEMAKYEGGNERIWSHCKYKMSKTLLDKREMAKTCQSKYQKENQGEILFGRILKMETAFFYSKLFLFSFYSIFY